MKKIFTLALSFAAVVAASAQCYVVGPVNGNSDWADADNIPNYAELTEKEAGVYTGEVSLESGWFGISEATGTWDDVNAMRWFPADGKAAIEIGQEKAIAIERVQGGEDAFNLGTAATVTFTVDLNEGWFKVESEGEIVVDMNLYLRGGGTDPNWGALPEYQFTEDPAGTWTLNTTVEISEGFKIANPGWLADLNFGSAPVEEGESVPAVELGTPYTLYAGGDSGNLFFNETITATKMVVTITADGATLLVEGSVGAIEDIEIDSNEAVEYYNLQGVKVNGELPAGLYIAKQGVKTSKVIVK